MEPRVRFVYSNHPAYAGEVIVPEELGVPRAGHHFTSTPADNLIELAGRTCYDSLKTEKSRNSVAYHQHINEVKHTSVQRHANFTLELELPTRDIEQLLGVMALCANRPGVYVRPMGYADQALVRVTANVNALREWESWHTEIPGLCDEEYILGMLLRDACWRLAPLAMGDQELEWGGETPGVAACKVAAVAPETENEVWASLFFTGVSRGLSHEQVRHSYGCAVSQRSSRYCDEDESVWVLHPAMRSLGDCVRQMQTIEAAAKRAYVYIRSAVESDLVAGGADKLTARKQARGAARCVLGTALPTEFLFSASIAQWKRMIAQRHSPAADGEINEVYGEVKVILADKFPTFFT